MGLEIDRQVSARVAPLQQELDAVKLELQQLRGVFANQYFSTAITARCVQFGDQGAADRPGNHAASRSNRLGS